MSYLHILKDTDGTAVTEDRTHKRIHDGHSFMTHHNDSALASASTINVYFKTDASQLVHILYNVIGSDAFDFEILEAPTVTSNTGTNAHPVYNKNRNSATVSTVLDNATSPAGDKVGLDVTVTADGTIINSEVFGNNKGGGDFSLIREIVLKLNTAYVFRLTSRSAGNRCHINLDWYEPQ